MALSPADPAVLAAVRMLLALNALSATPRYRGSTGTAAPSSGTYAVGDFVLGTPDAILVCTVAGTPGTWAGSLGGGGGGGTGQIGDQLLAVDTATFDFQNIPGSYNHLQLVVYGRTSEASVPSDFSLRFNGDSGANYRREYHRGSQDANEANHSTAATAITSATIAGNSAVASRAGSAVLWIPNYTGTTFFKTVNLMSGAYGGESAAQPIVVHAVGSWDSTAAITRVTLQVQSGANFLAGSRATLYGLL